MWVSRDHGQPTLPPPRPAKRVHDEANLVHKRNANRLAPNASLVQHCPADWLFCCAYGHDASAIFTEVLSKSIYKRAGRALDPADTASVGYKHEDSSTGVVGEFTLDGRLHHA